MRKMMRIGCLLVALLCAWAVCAFALAADTTLTIPAQTKVIDVQAFNGTNVSVLVIPESVEEIASGAFQQCPALTDVYLQSNSIVIADDAFDAREDITFHVAFGSNNEKWAIAHGYQTKPNTVQIITEGDTTAAAIALINREGMTGWSDAGKYGTGRLILTTKKSDGIPDLSAFDPKQIIAVDSTTYLIQLHNEHDAEACATALEAWDGCLVVEPDFFIVGADTDIGLNSRGINVDDPMGFRAFVDHLPDSIGNVTIAIIDTGLNSTGITCSISPKSYDFVKGAYRTGNNGSNSHGTTVAGYLCEAFGDKASHLTVISYKISDSVSGGTTPYFSMTQAVKRAKQDGADFVVISYAGSTTGINPEDIKLLPMYINSIGSGNVFAAAGNYGGVASAQIPGKYCTTVAAVGFDGEGNLVRVSTSASGANYGGFASATSWATPKVAAAAALLSLDPHNHRNKDDEAIVLGDILEPVLNAGGSCGMPNLGTLVNILVDDIIINYGQPVTTDLFTNEILTLYYQGQPANATNKNINVTIENDDPTIEVISFVSKSGSSVKIKAVNPGRAKLVFASEDGNTTVQIPFVVTQLPDRISISGAESVDMLMKGESVQLKVSVLPENTTNKNVVWQSSNTAVATVDETGIVTQVGVGTGEVMVTITAVSAADPSISASVEIMTTDEVAVKKITVAPDGGISTLRLGKTAGSVQMNAAVMPEEANQTVTWDSSNPEVATVDENGRVTAVGRGEALIYAYSPCRNIFAWYPITVVQLPVSITITGESTVIEGDTITLSADVAPDNADNKVLTWSTSNTDIATVSSDGVVTGISNGTVFVYATAEADQTVIGSKAITVKPATVTVTFDANGGTCDKTSMVATRGVAFGTLPMPIRTGYDFDGWYGSVTGAPFTSESTLQECNDITLVAHWTAKTYTVSFNANGGPAAPNVKTVTYDSTYGELTNPQSRTGYTFTGWYTAASGGTEIKDSTTVTITAAQTLYAHWTPNTYTVNYNANGGSVTPTSKTVTYDSTYGSLATPTRTGYKFDGWFTATAANGGGDRITESTKVTITATQTIYAHWTANEYTYSIVYKSVNGTSLGTDSVKKPFGTTNTITPPAYAGYDTPAAQSVKWDTTSKTITFTYQPTAVEFFTKTYQWMSSPVVTFDARVEYQNRTANSVEVRVYWKNTINAGGHLIYSQKIYGTCGGVSIPTTTIVPYEAWNSASSSKRSKEAYTSWITVPLSTTEATTLSMSIKCHQYNSNNTDVSTLSSVKASKYEATWTINIPAY